MDSCYSFAGQTHEDRRHALEKLGISVQSSGIKVEKNRFVNRNSQRSWLTLTWNAFFIFRCFLVNLNSDPSLSEMLVYYLKERTVIGRTGDIQFFGVGIQVYLGIFGLHLIHVIKNFTLEIVLCKHVKGMEIALETCYSQFIFIMLLLFCRCCSRRISNEVHFLLIMQFNQVIFYNSNKLNILFPAEIYFTTANLVIFFRKSN